MRIEQSLPDLDQASLKQSKAMDQCIKKLIAEHQGWLAFYDLMDALLYNPDNGYYCSQTNQFGRGGDFVTAPQISFLFSQTLAVQCQEILRQWPRQNNQISQAAILEIGAGSGEMAADLMRYLAAQKCLPEQYAIYEISPAMRQKQQAYLQQVVPELMPYFKWYSQLPKTWQGIILANELLDAMPVQLWQWDSGTVKEWGVTNQHGELTWQSKPADDQLLKAINTIRQSPGVDDWPNNYISEINPSIHSWMRGISDILEQGVLLLFDYGYPRAEYYRPERSRGTLKCFYQHVSHENPLTHLGCQDITAHVDFTTVVEAACEQGMTLEGFCTQADFLLSCGIESLTPQDYSMAHSPKVSLSQALKQLLMPEEMGEIVKVMGLSKGYEHYLQGFMRRDLSRQL